MNYSRLRTTNSASGPLSSFYRIAGPSLRFLLPLTLLLIFVVGYFIVYNGGSLTLRPSSLAEQYRENEERFWAHADEDLKKVIVDLMHPPSPPPSIVKIVDHPLHSPPSCETLNKEGSPQLQVIYLVFSAVDKKRAARRKAVRETWASLLTPDCGFRVLFVMGQAEKHAGNEAEVNALQKEVDEEAEKFKDILQFGQFIDSGKTPTLKAQMAFEWVIKSCPNVKYIGKAEDHVWMNVNDWHRFVFSQPLEGIFGHRVYSGTPVFRDPSSYFYVSRKEFAQDTYPEYICGMLYVIPMQTLQKLLEKSKDKSVPRIPVEDTYWTGILADAAGVPRRNLEGMEYDWITIDKKTVKCIKSERVSVRYMPPSEVYSYWNDKCAPNTLTVCAGKDQKSPLIEGQMVR